MRVDGKNYKSIPFSVLKDKLLSREKKQTMRMLFMPTYVEEETVAIAFKDPESKEKEFLYLVQVTKIVPKKLKDITLEDAQRDGFESIVACQRCLMDLNNRTLKHFVFITQWKDAECEQPPPQEKESSWKATMDQIYKAIPCPHLKFSGESPLKSVWCHQDKEQYHLDNCSKCWARQKPKKKQKTLGDFC